MPMKTFQYHKTNCFFIDLPSDQGLLAIDAGWPSTLYEYQRGMKAIGLDFRNLKMAFVTHLHMDHAGLLGEFVASGIRCFLVGNQDSARLAAMERIITKNRDYQDYRSIDQTRIERVGVEALNRILRSRGIAGTVVETPSHSPDSVSFLTDDHEAIVGDLAPIDQIMKGDRAAEDDWETILARGIRKVYPSHAAFFEL